MGDEYSGESVDVSFFGPWCICEGNQLKKGGSRRRWSAARAKCEHVSPYLQTSLCLQLGGACSCFFWHGMKCRKVNGSRRTERETHNQNREMLSATNPGWATNVLLPETNRQINFVLIHSFIFILPFRLIHCRGYFEQQMCSQEVFIATGNCWYDAKVKKGNCVGAEFAEAPTSIYFYTYMIS